MKLVTRRGPRQCAEAGRGRGATTEVGEAADSPCIVLQVRRGTDASFRDVLQGLRWESVDRARKSALSFLRQHFDVSGRRGVWQSAPCAGSHTRRPSHCRGCWPVRALAEMGAREREGQVGSGSPCVPSAGRPARLAWRARRPGAELLTARAPGRCLAPPSCTSSAGHRLRRTRASAAPTASLARTTAGPSTCSRARSRSSATPRKRAVGSSIAKAWRLKPSVKRSPGHAANSGCAQAALIPKDGSRHT